MDKTSTGMPAAVEYLGKEEGPSALISAVSDTIAKFIQKETPPKDSNINSPDNRITQQVSYKKKPILVFIPYFIFVACPKAIGRFILDMFGRDKATDITAIILGYIVILIMVLITKGVINPDDALNTFKDAWRFFFPIK